jgi:RNA polymerase sigma factor (sigma-70 family)
MRSTLVYDSRRQLNTEQRAWVIVHLFLADALAARQSRLTPDSMPREDFQAEARFALVDAARYFDPSRGVPFGAFATPIIRQRLYRVLRRWQQQRMLPQCAELARWRAYKEDWPVCEPTCPWATEAWKTTAGTELMEQLRRLLRPEWFEVLRLRYVENLSLPEISTKLGLSIRQVRRRQEKALNRARNLFPVEDQAA